MELVIEEHHALVYLWCCYAVETGFLPRHIRAPSYDGAGGGKRVAIDSRYARKIGNWQLAQQVFGDITWTLKEQATLRAALRKYMLKKDIVLAESCVQGIVLKLQLAVDMSGYTNEKLFEEIAHGSN